MKKAYTIFNILSIVFTISIISIYSYRYLHFKKLNKVNKEYSNILSERIIEEEKDFKLISEINIDNNVYYFTKSSKNNYLSYKGLTWRIIKINEDKSTMIILDDYVSILPINKVNDWINDKYSKLVNIDNLELLDLETYKTAGSKDSFINNKYDFWIKDNKYIDEDGKICDDDNQEHKIRPVLTLNKDTKILDGNGNIDNPFVITEENEIKSLKEINTSKYIKYNNTLWRIIDIDDDKIKLLSCDVIKDKDGNNIKDIFSSSNNDIKNYRKNSIIYYLNNDYYDSLENNEYLVKGKFYIGKYKDNDYTSIYEDYTKLKVGLPTLDDPYIYDSVNTFTFVTNENSDINIYSIENNKLYETFITEKGYIRPVIYMNKNIKVNNGLGTYSNPYILGGIIDEEN